jgi:N-acetylneuraminic acid mutarotase
MPTARYWVSAALGSNGKIYAIGGVDTTTNNVSAVEVYDPSTDKWSKVAALPGRALAAVGVAFLGGMVFAIGGSDVDRQPYATVEAYSLKTGTWLSQTAMPTPRGYLAAVASGSHLYAIGGYNNFLPFTGDLSQVEAS